jgi:uncharacterized repeat protein (TIGR03803 family)
MTCEPVIDCYDFRAGGSSARHEEFVGAMVLNLAKCTLVLGLIVTLSGVCKAPAALAAPQLTVLHSFAGGNDGRNVSGPLVRDAKGAIYGSTTEGGLYDRGTVFKLTPSTASDGEWKRRHCMTSAVERRASGLESIC